MENHYAQEIIFHYNLCVMILQQVVKEKMTEFYRNMFAEALGPDGNGGAARPERSKWKMSFSA